MATKPLAVDFSKTRRNNQQETYSPMHRRYGGCGIRSAPEPYHGPTTWTISARGRKFVIVHLSRSPNGSCHGAFRIEELKGGNKTIVLGYTCSYPDENACLRVANAL